MKIKEIRVVEITLNPKPKTPPRTPTRAKTFRLNRPIDRYQTPNSTHISQAEWKRPACIITAEDGTWVSEFHSMVDRSLKSSQIILLLIW